MTILDEILAHTRATVARRKVQTPVEMLKEMPGFSRAPRALAPALRRPHLAIIAESKKQSPSKGLLRAEYDAAANAAAYTQAGADALSVLTEPDFFGGHPDHLVAARAATTLPVLRKDFILDLYQIAEARAWGADAVLLIAAALDPALLRELYESATEMGLSVLVEVHGEGELDTLDLDRIEIVGVNNRDLKSFEVDVTRAPRIFDLLPRRIVRVAESGLRDAATLASLRRAGTDAVLIGETFMRAPQPGERLRVLRHEVQALLEHYPA